MLFFVFELSHCFVVVLLPSGRLALFPCYSLYFLHCLLLCTWIFCTWPGVFSETSSLAPRGSGTVCVHSTFPWPHLSDFNGSAVIVATFPFLVGLWRDYIFVFHKLYGYLVVVFYSVSLAMLLSFPSSNCKIFYFTPKELCCHDALISQI